MFVVKQFLLKHDRQSHWQPCEHFKQVYFKAELWFKSEQYNTEHTYQLLGMANTLRMRTTISPPDGIHR